MEENQDIVNPDHRIRYLFFSMLVILVITVGVCSYLYFSSSASSNSANLNNKNLDSVNLNTAGDTNLNTVKSCQSPAPINNQRIIYVFDNATCKPLAGAKVGVAIVESLGFSGPSEKEFITDENGIVILPENKLVKLVQDLPPELAKIYLDASDIGGISVAKDGFIMNGTGGIKDTQVYVVGLTELGQEELIQIGKGDQGDALYSDYDYKQNDALDLQTLTSSPRNFYNELLPVKDSAPYDFKFTVIGNTESARGVIGKGFATMEFKDQGGGQEIPVDTKNALGLLNLTTAPGEGYQKVLSVKSGGEYVARTRDGKHYFKFSIFSSKELSGESYVKMQIFMQRNESNDLTMGSVPSGPILEVDNSVTLAVAKNFGPIPVGSLEIRNVGTRDSNLTLDIRPLSANIEVAKTSDPQSYSGIDFRSFPENHIKIVQFDDKVKGGNTTNLQFYGNAAGKFELVTNGGSIPIEVKSTNPDSCYVIATPSYVEHGQKFTLEWKTNKKSAVLWPDQVAIPASGQREITSGEAGSHVYGIGDSDGYKCSVTVRVGKVDPDNGASLSIVDSEISYPFNTTLKATVDTNGKPCSQSGPFSFVLGDGITQQVTDFSKEKIENRRCVFEYRISHLNGSGTYTVLLYKGKSTDVGYGTGTITKLASILVTVPPK